MELRNIPVITAAGIDVCTVANKHVLDWGYRGLAEALDTLNGAGVGVAGGGGTWAKRQLPPSWRSGERDG
jgi:poly-gamma-glutamate synthesis protein (capsule biosynthesis protein)